MYPAPDHNCVIADLLFAADRPGFEPRGGYEPRYGGGGGGGYGDRRGPPGGGYPDRGGYDDRRRGGYDDRDRRDDRRPYDDRREPDRGGRYDDRYVSCFTSSFHCYSKYFACSGATTIAATRTGGTMTGVTERNELTRSQPCFPFMKPGPVGSGSPLIKILRSKT